MPNILLLALHLEKSGRIKYDRKSGHFQITEIGQISSQCYCTHDTMLTYNQVLKTTLSLNFFACFRCPMSLESARRRNSSCSSCCSGSRSESHICFANMVYITQTSSRLLRAIYEIVLHREWAQLADRCSILS
ncbi:hypothetical protein pipiens_009987 [Culex pipiens pipiens]|uniref:Uncharacterized protein n=1 Tax=Culex pipiens pipiens TaxID=38569 RepID=A0ABD1DBZ1_CULPP